MKICNSLGRICEGDSQVTSFFDLYQKISYLLGIQRFVGEFRVSVLKGHRHRQVKAAFLWEIALGFFDLEKCEILKHTLLSISPSFCLYLEYKV